MAQVARATRSSPDIDYHLDYQFGMWGDVPFYVEQWPKMDASQKEVFHLEWGGITESRLQQLERWVEEEGLTSGQRLRYAQLRRLIAEYRPLVESLLNS